MSLINIVKDNYEAIPKWMIDAAGAVFYCIPERFRYGRSYADTWKILQETEMLGQLWVEETTNHRFVETVHHAYQHVPFYKKLYDAHGVDIALMKDLRDITLLPTISKQELRDHSNEMIADNVDPASLMYITTSGSTGNPVGFYQPKTMVMTEWAYTMHIWSRIGCSVSSSRLVLRGKKFQGSKENPNIRYDPLRRELSCNIFNMTEENLEKYCQAIEKYRPEFVHGYMSAIVMLAKHIQSRGGIKHHFKGVLATSETIMPDQKTFVEQALNTRVFSFYGHSERLVIAGECENSSDYHVEPLYGYCELLDAQGNTAQKGEIVGTGFLNPAMPLIRYRTGDIAAWSDDKTCSCGRSHRRLSGVEGRGGQDMLVNREGAKVSLTALNIHSEEFDRIIRYKFIQDTPGVVAMKILPGSRFSDIDQLKIEQLLKKKTDGKIDFHLVLTDNLPVGKNGKYQIVEQSLIID